MRRLALFLFALLAACKKAPPSERVTSDVAPAASLAPIVVNSPSIAMSNLDGDIDYTRGQSQRELRARFISALLLRGQMTGRFADWEEADTASARFVTENRELPAAHRARAHALAAWHRFDEAERELALARGEPVDEARAGIFLATGRLDEAAAIWDARGDTLDPTERAAKAMVAAERQDHARSERLFEEARTSFRDVSPFPIAFMDFARGTLLERRGESARAKLYFEEARSMVPTFAHAVVHLAALEKPERARELLAPLAETSDDPEVVAALADAERRTGREHGAHLSKARALRGAAPGSSGGLPRSRGAVLSGPRGEPPSRARPRARERGRATDGRGRRALACSRARRAR